MLVKMNDHLWKTLKMDDPDRYNLVLCCFYLGRGLIETTELLNRGPDDPEVAYVLETAVYSGLDLSRDKIVRTS